jgi:hypothetical protein
MDNNITILLGILLTTSEILPYIKQIKGNGILEAFVVFVEIVKVKAKSLNNLGDNQVNNQDETAPLLENDMLNDRRNEINYLNQNLNFSSNLNENLKKENEDVNININSENVFIILENDMLNDRHNDINYLNENLKKENEDVNININSENVYIKLNTVTSINYV